MEEKIFYPGKVIPSLREQISGTYSRNNNEKRNYKEEIFIIEKELVK